MNFFTNPANLQELRDQYKALCFKYHPDVTGEDTTKEMQKLNAEFDSLSKQLAKGLKYEASEIEFNTIYKEKIEVLIKIKNIEIEIVGNWLWVTGDTKPVKELLKEMKFMFSPKKVAWYYKNYKYSKSNSELSLDAIRSLYGSTKVSGSNEQDENKALAY